MGDFSTTFNDTYSTFAEGIVIYFASIIGISVQCCYVQLMSFIVWFHQYLDYELGGMYAKDHQNSWNYHPETRIDQYNQWHCFGEIIYILIQVALSQIDILI